MEASGRFVGIDLGKRTYDMCLVEPKGKITRTNGKTDFKGIDKLCEKLGADDLVAIEACNLAMRIERRIRQTVGCKVYILNPGKLAVIYMSTRKTDKEDALKLAKLLKNHDEDSKQKIITDNQKSIGICDVVRFSDVHLGSVLCESFLRAGKREVSRMCNIDGGLY